MNTDKLVHGRGPADAKILLLGEKPGVEELRMGRAFVGRTGTELDKVLWKAGVNQDNMWLDNLLQDRPTGDDYLVTEEDLERNSDHILQLLSRGWDTIIAMGAVATKYLLGDGVRADIGTVHGFEHETDWGKVFTTWHVAAGLHDSDAYPYIAHDFQLLGAYLNGHWTPPDRSDKYPKPRYTPLNDRDCSFIRNKFNKERVQNVAVDTEGKVSKPWSLSFSGWEGEGFMIQPQHKYAIQTLAECITKYDIKLVMHYAVHDIPVLRAMGWDLSRGHSDWVYDTMVMAYLLQIEPQGLKNLAYRHCGMDMNDYLDLVSPYSLDQRLDYLYKLAEEEWEKYPEPILIEKKNSTKITQPHGLNRLLKTLIKKLETDPYKTDIWKWWNDQYEEVRKPAIEKFGELPSADLDDVPFEEAYRYSCEDSSATIQVFNKLLPRLEALDLHKTFLMDCAVIPHIEEMQTTGFGVDKAHFERLVVKWRGEQGKIRKELADDWLEGRYINPESPTQVAPILFGKIADGGWGLPVFKETDTGRPSTSDKAIDWLKDRHPGVGLIGKHRELDKGVTSFAAPIIRFSDNSPDSRLHTNLKYTRVVSGRFSAADPNLLAMPVRTDLGREIRNGFVAGDGRLLGSWDLNQIEMRFMAHESEDVDLIDAYNHDADIHKETACRMFECRIEDVTNEQREVAKRISFGVITGIQGKGLRDQFYLNGITKYSEANCDDFIRIWFDARRGVKTYIERCKAEARRYGYVRESIGGRIRYLQGVQSTSKKVMAESERASHSHKISAGAQAYLKIAMRQLWPVVDELRKADGVDIKWILQVHDELIFEFPEGYEEVVDALVTDVLCNAVKLRVPVKAKGKWAKTWGKLK